LPWKRVPIIIGMLGGMTDADAAVPPPDI
jgi:hypothetical protein